MRQIRVFGAFRWGDIPLVTVLCSRVPRRKMRALSFASAGGLAKVLVGHLQIVLTRHDSAVAEPRANDVFRPVSRQFGLPCGSEVLPKLRPRLHAGPGQNPLELRAEICVPLSISRDDVFNFRRGLLVGSPSILDATARGFKTIRSRERVIHWQ